MTWTVFSTTTIKTNTPYPFKPSSVKPSPRSSIGKYKKEDLTTSNPSPFPSNNPTLSKNKKLKNKIYSPKTKIQQEPSTYPKYKSIRKAHASLAKPNKRLNNFPSSH